MPRKIILLAAVLGASRASAIADRESASSTSASFNRAAGSEKAAPKGYRVQYVGHSFHMFVPTVMASLAKEAGISGHQSLGLDFLPASYPCQHWNKNPNTVKNVLNAGKADVLTLATRELAPDDCISKFAQLAVRASRPWISELMLYSSKETRISGLWSRVSADRQSTHHHQN
jgi:hypothetical protein